MTEVEKKTGRKAENRNQKKLGRVKEKMSSNIMTKSEKKLEPKNEGGLNGIMSSNIMTKVEKKTGGRKAQNLSSDEMTEVIKKLEPKSAVTQSSDLDADGLTFTAMKKTKYQYNSYVNHEGKDCIIMTPPFEMTYYGIPQESSDNNYDRNYVNIPLDNNPTIEELLENIDGAFLKNSETVFGKLINLSTKTRIPLVKSPDDKPKYFKLKLPVDYNSKNILPRIFVKGKPVEVKTINDVAEHITWISTIQVLMKIEKIWANNSVFLEEPVQEFGMIAPENKDAKFGVSLSAIQINVIKEKEVSQRSKNLDALYKSNTVGQ